MSVKQLDYLGIGANGKILFWYLKGKSIIEEQFAVVAASHVSAGWS